MSGATLTPHVERPGHRRGGALRVLAIHLKLGGLQELQYRANFVSALASSSISMGVSLVSLALVYRHVDELNGWAPDELLVVVGVFFAITSIVMMVVHPSLCQFASDVTKGEFDFRLLKPVDAQLLASVRAVDVWQITDLLSGVGITTFATIHIAHRTGIEWGSAALAPVMFVAGTTIVYGFWLLISCLVFWATRLEGVLWALDEMLENVRWPISIFPPGLRIALTTIFPAGFAITVPAQAVTGRLTWLLALSAIGFAIGIVAAARLVWRRGIARYASASS